VLRALLIDEQFGLTDNVEKEHMRDFQLNFLFNLSSHLDARGNARRDNTLKQTADSREQSWAQRNRCRANIKSK
jgi:hypothetical protein